ncbi:hypothetical protein Slin14017_G063540 [Septoria linicola]|nr:hypothetical protein Slin14017_G063540 [Septoria linicola]
MAEEKHCPLAQNSFEICESTALFYHLMENFESTLTCKLQVVEPSHGNSHIFCRRCSSLVVQFYKHYAGQTPDHLGLKPQW